MIAALRCPVVDANDPGAAVLATTSGTPPAQLEHALQLAADGAHKRSGALRRSTAATGPCIAGDSARRQMPASGWPSLEPKIAGDWRLKWYAGQCELLEGDFARPVRISMRC